LLSTILDSLSSWGIGTGSVFPLRRPRPGDWSGDVPHGIVLKKPRGFFTRSAAGDFFRRAGAP
jgi:hypothetical protein